MSTVCGRQGTVNGTPSASLELPVTGSVQATVTTRKLSSVNDLWFTTANRSIQGKSLVLLGGISNPEQFGFRHAEMRTQSFHVGNEGDGCQQMHVETLTS